MSRDLLEKILNDKNQLNIDEIIKFLITFKKGSFIYPSVLKRKFQMSDEDVYKILSKLEKEKVLKLFYELFCYQCNNSIGLFEYYSQIPTKIICEQCESYLGIDNIKIVYKVIK